MSAEFGLAMLLIAFPVYLIYTGKFNKYLSYATSSPATS